MKDINDLTVRDVDNYLKRLEEDHIIDGYSLKVCDTPISGLLDCYVDVLIRPIIPINDIRIEFSLP